MAVGRIIAAVLAGSVWAAGGAGAWAEGDPALAAEVQALRDRLDQAEERIQKWESRAADEVARDQPPADPANDAAPLPSPKEEDKPEWSKTTEEPSESEESHTGLLNDLAAGKGFVKTAGESATMQLSGRIQIDYWTFPYADLGAAVLEGPRGTPLDPPDRFGLRRLRIGARGEVGENAVYRFDVEFSDPSRVQFRDAFIGLTDLPWVQTVLVGNQKRPYGLDTINSTNFNVFLERPTVMDAFNVQYRRLGIQSWSHTEDLGWNWRYGLFNGENVQGDGNYVGDAYQLEFAGRLAQTWWYDEDTDGRRHAHRAVSFAVAHPDGDSLSNTARFFSNPQARTTSNWLDTGLIDGAEWYQLLGSEHLLNLGPLQLVGEVQNIWLQREGGSDLHFWGAYGYVAYFLTGEHMAWDRETGQLARIKVNRDFVRGGDDCGQRGGGWGAWQVAARYSYLDMADRDVQGGAAHESSLALLWYWNSNTRVQLEWEHGWFADQSKLAAAGVPDAEFDAIGLRLSVDF